jgi:hypothetical protein
VRFKRKAPVRAEKPKKKFRRRRNPKKKAKEEV